VVELPTRAQAAAFTTSPVAEVKPTLIHALEHIPPAPARSPSVGSDDLTPPPDTSEMDAITNRVVEQVVDQVNADMSFSPSPEVDEEVETKPTPKKRVRKAGPKKDGETPKVTPKKRVKKAESGSEGDDYAEGEEGVTPSKKAPKKKTPKKSRIAEDEPDFDEDGNELPKKKKKVKVYPKIEYDIPDVEKKTTTFRGERHSFFSVDGADRQDD